MLIMLHAWLVSNNISTQTREENVTTVVFNFNSVQLQRALVLEDYAAPTLRVQGFVSRKKGARSMGEEKKEGEKKKKISTTNLAACVCPQNLTNFCPYAFISSPNVPKILFA